MAAHKKVTVDAATSLVLSEPERISSLKEKKRMTLMASIHAKHVFVIFPRV